MSNRFVAIAALSLMVLLAACGQQSERELPTLAPTLAPVQATETPAATQQQPTEAPSPVPLERPTFPPTWTPTVEASPTVITATPTLNATIQALQAQPTEPGCATFADDPTRYSVTFRVGSPVTVAWLAAEGAISYRVFLIDDTGRELFDDYTSETQFVFSADLFQRGKRYGWEVYPINSLGQQFCLRRGSELIGQ